MQFQFSTASKIIFGVGSFEKIGQLAVEFGQKAFVVTGSGGAKYQRLFEMLKSAGISWEQYVVHGEPTVDNLNSGVEAARRTGCDFVIGFGGGSVLDTGKAVSAMLTNSGDIVDYLEIVGKGMLLQRLAAPYIAIPTTAGTGTEVTRNAVLMVPDRHVKVSLRSDYIIPRVALVDPELTYSMPSAITASTGMDALTQVLEPYVSNKANLMTDVLAKEGITRASSALLRVFSHPNDVEARSDMAWTSLLGGLCLANAKLGAVHGFAGPFGGMYDAPHGAVCGRLLPFVVEMNIKLLLENSPESPYLRRYKDISAWLTGNANATLQEGVDWLFETMLALKIPGLSTYGLTYGDFPELIEKSLVSSSMKGNPVELKAEDLQDILKKAF